MIDESIFQGNMEINEKEGVVTISVQPKIYPLDVVLSSAYIFTDDNYILVDGDPQEELLVEIRPKKQVDLETLGRKFNNELINYATYAVSTIKNEKLREAIIKRVLLTNSDQEELFEPEDVDTDDIPKPWEEEYSDK